MTQYDEDGNPVTNLGMIEIKVRRGAETIDTEVPEGSTVQALIEDGHLRGVTVASTRLNGSPADGSSPLQQGDTVEQVPKSGKQGY
jgi:hypothetical protein